MGCIFGELLNLSPLFPGENDIEQLCCVLRALGTPSPRVWPVSGGQWGIWGELGGLRAVGGTGRAGSNGGGLGMLQRALGGLGEVVESTEGTGGGTRGELRRAGVAG